MTQTIDLSPDETDCVVRALTAYITATTQALRAPACAQLSAQQLERMHDDIRTAATLTGRIAIPIRIRMEHAK